MMRVMKTSCLAEPSQGYMFRAAFLRKVPLFIRNFSENVLLCLAAAGVESTANRFLERLKLTWRDVLTQRVHATYFAQMVGRPSARPAFPARPMLCACAVSRADGGAPHAHPAFLRGHLLLTVRSSGQLAAAASSQEPVKSSLWA
jgi:hypothetical protein